ncbi:hypothetical protein P152DRAFT_513983 [Eremomyces bilateralis CBS 781.70]|uniref:Pentatricopeptide repeat protein n=1 Tax=Eremomyces bilateralis CBS 781.70 TaxID=1392243 RepID=A0A6G1G4Z4_9PEZI|nr:uncharacterized protein P152DRAFT_513983 [Eremomyces bilateralis CBS 781.70]KAF1812980.1 hypothetical protein P152DRAFT_513983 [Eremomyces bilateralis CBS 781.70]
MLKRCIGLQHACNHARFRIAVNAPTIRTLTVRRLVAEGNPRTPKNGGSERRASDSHERGSNRKDGRAADSHDRSANRKDGSGPNAVVRRPSHNPKSLEAELRWLKDPVRLADHVQRLLLLSEVSKATEMIHLASKTQKCTVPWNLLLDHLMRSGKVNEAMKTFNDMKKRAQAPDSYTFTTLLRGLARYADKVPTAPSRAVALFHSMSAPNSRVEPMTMHANAALSVCARGNAADELWGIISRLPEHGPCAPDHITYSIVLTFLHDQVLADNELKDFANSQFLKRVEEGNEKMRQVEEAVLRGRRIWAIVRDKWMNGDIVVEEGLVCAMGRLLLLSNDVANVRDIFVLAEQTMGIPNISKKKEEGAVSLLPAGSSGTRPGVDGVDKTDKLEEHEHGESDRKAGISLDVPSLDPSEGPRENEFTLIPQLVSGQNALVPNDSAVSTRTPNRRPTRHVPISYVKLGNNTLSLLLEACLKLRLKVIASEYFSLLTSKSGPGWDTLLPDEAAMDMLLRVFRATRSSQETVHALEVDFPAAGIKPTRSSYLIALSACARRLKNLSGAFRDADNIVRMMFEQSIHDPKCLSVYVTTAQKAHGRVENMAAIHRLLQAVEPLRGYVLGHKHARHYSQADCLAVLKELRGRITVVLDTLGQKLGEGYKEELKAKMKDVDSIIFEAHHQEPVRKIHRDGGEGREG